MEMPSLTTRIFYTLLCATSLTLGGTQRVFKRQTSKCMKASSSVPASSLAGCAYQCIFHESCTAFQFDETKKRCRLSVDITYVSCEKNSFIEKALASNLASAESYFIPTALSTALVTPRNLCEEGWVGNNVFGTCILYVNTPKTWVNAKAHCSNLSAHLIHLSTQEYAGWLQSYRRITGGIWLSWSIWTGGVCWNDKLEGTCTDWRWSSGATMNFTNWESGQPDGSGFCVQIHDRQASEGKWDNAPCSDQLHFICEKSQL